MPDPNVKSWVSPDGAKHWGAVAPDNAAKPAPAVEAEVAPAPSPKPEVAADAPADAPNSDRQDAGRAKRRP